MKKKIISIILACIMTLATLPTTAFAASGYVDVAQDAWYYDSVTRATDLGLMNGYGNGYFGPEAALTKAEAVQVVYNYTGTDMGAGGSDLWYAKAITWAKAEGLLSYMTGDVDWNSASTREEVIFMLYAVANNTTPVDTNTLAQFTDASDISQFAYDAAAWAVERGIITGMSEQVLAPRGTLTRAQLATMLVRYIDLVASTGAAYGKSSAYPTVGAAATVNKNGYRTNANVDIKGSVLHYEFLQPLNEYLAQLGLPPAMWTTADEVEEYTLCRAKETATTFTHVRPNGNGAHFCAECLASGITDAMDAFTLWQNSRPHNDILTKYCSGAYICIASYGDTWCLTAWPTTNDNYFTNKAISLAWNNYYAIEAGDGAAT